VLAEITVKAFGIIEQITWRLSEGFNVITGETGAGKSLVIDAVEALLDGRLSEESIRYGADESRIEAVFFLPENDLTAQLKFLLKDKGIELDEENLVISCEFRRQGRAVLRINGSAVPRSLLRDLGSRLVAVHGQSQHLSLFDNKNHLEYLDSYARLNELKNDFNQKTQVLYRIEQEKEKLVQTEKERGHREEILSYQVDEIRHAKLKDDEDKELEQRRNILAASERLKALAFESYEALNGEDIPGASALTHLNESLQALRRLTGIDPLLLPQMKILEEAVSNLQETAREVRSYRDRLEYNPVELEEIENRLELIRSLKKKYGASIQQVNIYLVQTEKELLDISNLTEDITRLEEERSKLRKEMAALAGKLSQQRQAAAGKLANVVQKELSELNMAQVKFDVHLHKTISQSGLLMQDGKCYNFTHDGVDEVEFMVSTNPGEPMKPLAAIASTGEVSRFTLALKVALAEADKTPVLIFDEIDIGIGGRSGEIIGRKLWALARHHQVICVTHLPQIAAFADAHFNVYKEIDGLRTLSFINTLNTESRLKEMALMLGGPQGGDVSLDNAADLLQKAQIWIKTQDRNKVNTKKVREG
jgi:DNA repair protein RecN (Recombination protein N)